MYTGPLVKAMRKAFPGNAVKRNPKWVVLEDNDPTGYKSHKAIDAKSSVGISTLDLPRRSPDLNVLDYCLWHEINVRMRKQEKKMSKAKKEPRVQYLERLRRTALMLPTQLVQRGVKDMRRRVGLIVQAKGSLFNE